MMRSNFLTTVFKNDIIFSDSREVARYILRIIAALFLWFWHVLVSPVWSEQVNHISVDPAENEVSPHCWGQRQRGQSSGVRVIIRVLWGMFSWWNLITLLLLLLREHSKHWSMTERRRNGSDRHVCVIQLVFWFRAFIVFEQSLHDILSNIQHISHNIRNQGVSKMSNWLWFIAVLINSFTWFTKLDKWGY